MRVLDALKLAKKAKSGNTPTRLECEILLAHTLNKSRSFIITHEDLALDGTQTRNFLSLVKRREKGEPIAYLCGKKDFWSLTLKINSDTLIPRPDTETLVDTALDLIPKTANWTIADLGTGSGAIALAIAKERPHCHLHAIELSPAALAIAKENAKAHQIPNVSFHLGDWLHDFNSCQFQMILSNPPYISQSDPHLQQGDLRFEPRLALIAGQQGMQHFNCIIKQSTPFLLPPSYLLLEHGWDQAKSVADALCQNGYSEIKLINDIGNNPRVTQARRI